MMEDEHQVKWEVEMEVIQAVDVEEAAEESKGVVTEEVAETVA